MSKTAFETLSEYCEYNLEPDEYKIVPETSSYLATIYFITDGIVTYHCFDSEGNFSGSGFLDIDEDMNEHIEQAESEGKYEGDDNASSEIVADPPLSSIGGMMVRKMIEAYERNQNGANSH